MGGRHDGHEYKVLQVSCSLKIDGRSTESLISGLFDRQQGRCRKS